MHCLHLFCCAEGTKLYVTGLMRLEVANAMNVHGNASGHMTAVAEDRPVSGTFMFVKYIT